MSIDQARAGLSSQVKKHNEHGGVLAAEAVQNARRDLAAEKLAEHVRRTVAAAPPLSDAQKQRLLALLWSER